MRLKRFAVYLLATLSFAGPAHALTQLSADPITLTSQLPETLGRGGARYGAAMAGGDEALVVGAPGANEGRGGILFHPRKGGDWVRNASNQPTSVGWGLAPFTDPGDQAVKRVPLGAQLGASVAVSGDLIAVGAPGGLIHYEPSVDQNWAVEEIRQDGAVYIFQDTGDEDITVRFVLRAIVRPPEGEAVANFGAALAFRENILAVGAPGDDDAGPVGAVVLYEISQSADLVSARLLKTRRAGANNANTPKRFGGAIDMLRGQDGVMYLAVGYRPATAPIRLIPYMDVNPVYIYATPANDWTSWEAEPYEINPIMAQLLYESFGFSVKLMRAADDSLMLLVGAPYANTSVNDDSGVVVPFIKGAGNAWTTSPGNVMLPRNDDAAAFDVLYHGYTMAALDSELMVGSTTYRERATGEDSRPWVVFGELQGFDGLPTTVAELGDRGHYVKSMALTSDYMALGLPVTIKPDSASGQAADVGLLVTASRSGTLPPILDTPPALQLSEYHRGKGAFGALLLPLGPQRVAAMYTPYRAPSPLFGYVPPSSALLLLEPTTPGTPWSVKEELPLYRASSYATSLNAAATTPDSLLLLNGLRDGLRRVDLTTPGAAPEPLAFKAPLLFTPSILAAHGALAPGAEGEGLVVLCGEDDNFTPSVAIMERQGEQLVSVPITGLESLGQLPQRVLVRPTKVVLDMGYEMLVLRRVGVTGWEMYATLPLDDGTETGSGAMLGLALHGRWLFRQVRHTQDRPANLSWYDLDVAPGSQITQIFDSLELVSSAHPTGYAESLHVSPDDRALYIANRGEVLVVPLSDEAGPKAEEIRVVPLGNTLLHELPITQIAASGSTIWTARSGVNYFNSDEGITAPLGVRITNTSTAAQPSQGGDPRYPTIGGTTTPGVTAKIVSRYEGGAGAEGDKMEVGDEVVWELLDQNGMKVIQTNDDGTWAARPAQPLAGGTHIVSITFDPGGPFESVLDPLVISVNLGALMITSPGDGEVLETNLPEIKGTGPIGAPVKVIINDKPYTVEVDDEGLWSLTPDEPLTGELRIVAEAEVNGVLESVGVTARIERELDIISVDELDGAVIGTTTPTFTGKAPMGDRITCTINDRPPLTGITPNASESWYYAPGEPLEVGEHQLVIEQERPDGTKLPARTVFFTVLDTGNRAPLQRQRCAVSTPGSPAEVPLTLLLAAPALVSLRRRRKS